MPPRTVTDRLRVKLADLFQDRRFSKAALCRYCNKPYPWISGILHGGRGVRLNDLDNIAAYFRISIGELLGVAKPGELSGDEQRMIHAFRVLPPRVQEHFMAVIEQASLAPRIGPHK